MDDHADFVVIGAGPTGAAAAWRLAAAGRDVLVLDRGDWVDDAAIDRESPGWERRRAGALHANPNIRRGPADYPVDDADSPIKPMIGNGIGGSSTWWSAHVPRFRPDDFRGRSIDGAGDDWPLGYDDLAPYYDLCETAWGVAGVTGDPTLPPVAAPRLPLPTIGAHGARLARTLDALGWHWWPVDLVVGRDAEAPATVHCTHPGPCDIGCPSRRRSNAARAFVAEAVGGGARVRTHARVAKLELDAAGRVAAALVNGPDGPYRVTGRQFLVAANGMGTPRLLLLSACDRFPNGLANSSGQLGRNLMLHPYARVDGRFAAPVGAWAPGEKAGIISFEFVPSDPARGFVRGCKLQLVGGPGPLATALGAVTGERLPWGAGHHAAFAAAFDHLLGFTVCAEDLPEPDNRITLSGHLVDQDGLPAPKMIYRLSENSRRILDFGMARAAEALRAAGAETILETPLRAEAGFHLMGTARMGDDPSTSVVDRFGRCHDVPNLALIDASVFVSSAVINPTATAQALALRAVDHLLETSA